MQIRLTVRGPRGGQARDVLVTAPAGTALGVVAGALAATAGTGQAVRSGASVALFAGAERLDATATLGHPPLVDGAVIALHAPSPDHAPRLAAPPAARLHVIGGPDAGGVHLLPCGTVRVGRSAEADVLVDDPDVSRLHSVVTVAPGRVTVADAGSTNGTTVNGVAVGDRPVPLAPGALLRVGESTLIAQLPETTGSLTVASQFAQPDGEGHLRVRARGDATASPPPLPAPGGRPAEPPPGAAGRPERGGPGSVAKAFVRLLAGPGGTGRDEAHERQRAASEAQRLRERYPDPAALLLAALGGGPGLWERGTWHPDAFTVRLGTTGGQSAPVSVDLRAAGVLGIAGPLPKLHGVARSVVAQLAAVHGPGTLEVVLLADSDAEEWAWLRWLPHLLPAQGQDCRLLLGLDGEQRKLRMAELAARLDAPPAGRRTRATLLLVDPTSGRVPGGELARLLRDGPAAGIYTVYLAADPAGLPGECGARAVLTGDVAAYLDVSEVPAVQTSPAPQGGGWLRAIGDAVSVAWAERFARALAPLRETEPAVRPRSPLPDVARLLDALDLALATPSKISARWAELPATGGSAMVTLGLGEAGRLALDLAQDGRHLLVGGAPGAGKTELLRGVAASLAAADRPDRLGLVLVDGAAAATSATGGEVGLRPCTDLPHVTTYLNPADPVRAREFARALAAELDRREAILAGRDFASWQAERLLASSTAPPERNTASPERPACPLARLVVVVDDFDDLVAPAPGFPGRPAAGSMVRALDAVARRGPRLGVHLVVATGRPERTAGTDVDDQARLRIALRTDDPASSALLVHIDEAAGIDESVPGRGYLRRCDGAVVAFQAGRISGRIPRTATLRPTVVPQDWRRLGDPPTRRPVRELGNGPTDLALLGSALQRAAESIDADPAPPLM